MACQAAVRPMPTILSGFCRCPLSRGHKLVPAHLSTAVVVMLVQSRSQIRCWSSVDRTWPKLTSASKMAVSQMSSISISMSGQESTRGIPSLNTNGTIQSQQPSAVRRALTTRSMPSSTLRIRSSRKNGTLMPTRADPPTPQNLTTEQRSLSHRGPSQTQVRSQAV